MAKRNHKAKNDSGAWLSSVRQNPPRFDKWKQWSRHLPLQPKRKKALSVYADRNLGILLMVAAVAIIVTILLWWLLKDPQSDHTDAIIPLGVFFLVALGMLKVGVDHIRYSAK